ncbi:MAG: type II/IV secretion system protein, partial [Myxococcales bacterium]|nr:type II/IV secretion system protein [Myxococcales bacterium]
GAITRMRDLGVPGFLLASSLIGVVAQRLCRKVCPHCSSEANMTLEQAAAIGITIPEGTSAMLPVKRGRGCPRCRQTGRLGRLGIYELLPVTDTIRELIRKEADAPKIMKAATADGMTTLREAAIRHLAEGQTDYEEVLRAIGGI